MDAYNFIRERISMFPDVKSVTAVSGLSALEGLVDDVRNNTFPCIAVEEGADGALDLTRGLSDKAFHTFYVMIKLPNESRMVERLSRLDLAKRIGLDVLKVIKSESLDLNSPCYGFDASDVSYSRFGPVGFGCYGYLFNYTVTNDAQ